MIAWRNWILERRRLALLLVVIVLFAKMLVPTGYMFASNASGFTVEMCVGQGAMPVMMGQAMGMGQMHHGKTAPADDHMGKMDAPCAFSGIGMVSTAAADFVLLAVAIAFIVALGTRPVRASTARIFTRLRPPLRAPPVSG